MIQQSVTIAIETSSRMGSVALAYEENLLSESSFSEPFRHSSELLPTLRDLLEQKGLAPCQIKYVFISIGPGSFTGLRIAVATAKAMALANDARIVTVSTLDAIAVNATAQPPVQARSVAAILDAKRNKFFVAAYKVPAHDQFPGQLPEKILDDCVMTPQAFADSFVPAHGPVAILGDGLVYYADRFASDQVMVMDSSLWSPRAQAVFHLGLNKARQGLFTDPMALTPNYLRSPGATPKSTL
jgi:tRNA threonylcarbamoyladenosine biosynthesis protein TsaB